MTDMKTRYAEYLKKFGLAYEKPDTYEEFAAKMEANAAREAADEKAAESITDYALFVAEAQGVSDKWGAEDIVDRMQALHDDICAKLFEEGDRAAIGAHVEAFKDAKKEIMAPYKVKRNGFVHCPPATQVYDDDDKPTTYR